MKKIDVHGLGKLLIEIYDREGVLTELQILKEAEKAIRRAVINYETRISSSNGRTAKGDELQERS